MTIVRAVIFIDIDEDEDLLETSYGVVDWRDRLEKEWNNSTLGEYIDNRFEGFGTVEKVKEVK